MLQAIRQMEYIPMEGEKNNEPSETIQGQSLTVSEVLTKFSQGLLPELNQSIRYDEEPDFDSYDPTFMSDFDYTDAEQINERIDYLNQQLKRADSTEPISSQTTVTEQESETSL